MDKELWNEIVKFEFDDASGEYDFVTRLAKENFWTKNFTYLAIIEYKKFMYLAAKNHVMVSPSNIVDIVWHQHLLFTKSYNKFCVLLKKKIQHIPSTHNKKEFNKFQQAKKKTKELYEKAFGKQPKIIWENETIFDSLNLKKARFKLRSFIIYVLAIFTIFSIPLFILLKPIYLSIKNPNFIYSYIGGAIVILLFLEFYNQKKLNDILYSFDSESFIFNLQPLELVYLKTQKISNVINGVMNNLIYDNTIVVLEKNGYQLELKNSKKKYTVEEE